MRRLAVLLGVLLLAGCGGAKSPSSTSSRTPAATAPPTTPTPTPTPTTTATATTPRSRTSATRTSTSTGAINVRVPARFTIAPNGSVSPPTITIPPHLPVELIVVSNAQGHRIALRSASLTVGPHAQAEALIDGLRAGSYPLNVDGAAKAVLTIGGAPGP